LARGALKFRILSYNYYFVIQIMTMNITAKITISSRIPTKIIENIDEIAKITQRNRSFHIQKALELYLDNYADLQISLDRLRDSSDKTISLTQMRDKLDV
jgi:RHH-type rel operon transcriptional repressor/antitoxin RelB